MPKRKSTKGQTTINKKSPHKSKDRVIRTLLKTARQTNIQINKCLQQRQLQQPPLYSQY